MLKLKHRFFRRASRAASETPSEAGCDAPDGDRRREPSAATRARTGTIRRLLRGSGIVSAAIASAALLAAYAAIVMYPQLPTIAALTDFQPTVPLRVYTADDVLIAQYGVERRVPLTFDEIPDVAKHAVLAAEDARFYEHHGIDVVGLVRAALADFVHDSKRQGASTITMQLARNFFLSRDKTYLRKIYEILLAMRIESQLSKPQILQLYMNQIYLGERSYGFGAAARTYFGKDLADLSIAQAAMLAGLPKAPSTFNPVGNPERARTRQHYVLRRMYELGYIGAAQYRAALAEPPYTRPVASAGAVRADYVGEMVRQTMVAQYGEAAYERGFRVWTTVRAADQNGAYAAVRRGVAAYDRRHRYEGPEAVLPMPSAALDAPARRRALMRALQDRPAVPGLTAAVVVSAGAHDVTVVTLDGRTVTLGGPALDFARSRTPSRSLAAAGLRPGAVVRIGTDADDRPMIDELPSVEAALVSVDPESGAIRALVGGVDEARNPFNHVTQAWRQPGSSFKPFVYSAALEKGFAPATTVDDAPFEAAASGDAPPWRPKEVGPLLGPISLREALTKSKNLAAVRILDAIGPDYARTYAIDRFGFSADKLVANLPMALGAGSVTPLQMAAAYAVFANGGYRVQPYLVARIVDGRGRTVFDAHPPTADDGAPRVIPAANSYIMTSLLESVAQHGTASALGALRRPDIAAKTGSTNGYRDGWLAGYQHSLVAVAWMGFDTSRTLGAGEWGSHTALPIWLDYMRGAMRHVPVYEAAAPGDVAVVDGELYEAAHAPGNGFVATVGDDRSKDASARAMGASASASTSANASATVPASDAPHA
ncbi:penicillin-binding protein 1A [Burkholderia oklahomensis]|uniref:Penicillin-binding protein 1A n=1 Tax=Burkholderia oklahomensis TaxID=342113 RepID=A0AAI8BC56_9BURK|nr:PBP1A family penicillin-binding protein [Burkholderia oklahomensis]AIO69592.1 mrcA, penicillin-binding 1 (Peptidoglycan synthetase) transmembrane protein [Burkholderia oklahomensis]AOI39178.1 penicillin-binding protein [Burkholderia oklahomensis EO147]KUY51667.1 penicillin-binding protein [Burkholderia oklahomensis EO147]QPS40469.1 PBP1A family penicillin-binding protein [Burkholderia oklahomensis]